MEDGADAVARPCVVWTLAPASPSQPEQERALLGSGFAAAASAGDDRVVDVTSGQLGAHGVGVVAAIQLQGAEVKIQPAGADGVLRELVEALKQPAIEQAEADDQWPAT